MAFLEHVAGPARITREWRGGGHPSARTPLDDLPERLAAARSRVLIVREPAAAARRASLSASRPVLFRP